MRFSVRDLLLVTVIVALVLAWWLDRRDLVLQLKEERSKIHYYKDLLFK